jgi:hypothetical protein
VPWPALTCQARLRQRVPFHTLPTRAQYIRNHPCQSMQSHTKVLLNSQASRGPAKPAHTFSAMPCPHMPSQASPMRASLLFPYSSQSCLKSFVPRHAKQQQSTDVLPSFARASLACTDLQCNGLPSHAKPGFVNACLSTLCQLSSIHKKSSVPKHAKQYQGTAVFPSVARASQACTYLQCHALPSHAKPIFANACLATPFQLQPVKAKFIRAKACKAIPRY